MKNVIIALSLLGALVMCAFSVIGGLVGNINVYAACGVLSLLFIVLAMFANELTAKK